MRGKVTADLVKGAVGMVQHLAVGFDNEAGFLAEEVDDERSDGMLSAELGMHDLPAAQHAPKLLFGRRGSASQCTCLESPGAQQARHAFLSAPTRNRLPPFSGSPPPSGDGLGVRLHFFSAASLPVARSFVLETHAYSCGARGRPKDVGRSITRITRQALGSPPLSTRPVFQ